MLQKITAGIILFLCTFVLGMIAPVKGALPAISVDQADADAVILTGGADVWDIETVILEKAREQLEQYYSSGNYRFSVQSRWIPDQLLQLSSDNILELELQGNVKRYTNFEVLYQQQGNRQRTEIQLKIETEQKLPVVTERIKRGEELSSENLIYQWVSLSRHSADYIPDAEMLEGKTLRKTLLSGQPVRETFISRDIIIKSGDEVKVIIERNGVQVQVTGEAREDGAKGDRIRVYSSETRKKYEGEVIRPGIIQWKNTL